MVDPIVLLAFVPASLLLNLSPGADMMFCLAQGLRSGKAPAVAASAGISAGAFIHTGLAGIGLSAVIAAYPVALDVIRWIGVAYLLWLAWQTLRGGAVRSTAKPLGTKRAFLQGFMVNLTNPKVILFVLAFVPQFVDPQRGSILGQFLTFGVILAAGGFVINAAVGILASQMAQMADTQSRFRTVLNRISAAVFVGLALRLIWVQRG